MMDSAAASPVNQSGDRLTRGLVDGLRSGIDGFAFMCRHPSLWSHGVKPVLLNILVAVAVLLGAIFFGQWLVNWATDGLGDGLWDRVKWWSYLFAMVFLTLGLAFISYLILMSAICSTSFSKLAREVEFKLGAKEDDLAEISTIGGIVDSLRAMIKLVTINLLLLLLNVIPGIGSLAAFTIGLYIDSYILGSEFLGIPLELRGKRWPERQEFARTWRGATLGIGANVTGLMFIPIVGAVFQTTTVVGAVLIHRRLKGLPTEVPREGETDSFDVEPSPETGQAGD